MEGIPQEEARAVFRDLRHVGCSINPLKEVIWGDYIGLLPGMLGVQIMAHVECWDLGLGGQGAGVEGLWGLGVRSVQEFGYAIWATCTIRV